jgi:hypothetical protein
MSCIIHYSTVHGMSCRESLSILLSNAVQRPPWRSSSAVKSRSCSAVESLSELRGRAVAVPWNRALGAPGTVPFKHRFYEKKRRRGSAVPPFCIAYPTVHSTHSTVHRTVQYSIHSSVYSRIFTGLGAPENSSRKRALAALRTVHCIPADKYSTVHGCPQMLRCDALAAKYGTASTSCIQYSK